MNAAARDWQKLQNILLLLLALTFCLYLPTLLHDAFADDEIYLAYMNRFLRQAPWSDLYQLFLKPQNPWEFLPLRDFTYWLDFPYLRRRTQRLSPYQSALVWRHGCGVVRAVSGTHPALQAGWAARQDPALCGVLLFACIQRTSRSRRGSHRARI
ncbi:MAG: hypothetical protein IPJ48_08215 [Propionivibrio sp.]|uniref:Uncharacterized protein n=1 Tax=Candidatus Propionivibrio dominans TaxID=2954373 RepID=A0A9D7F6R9_9RHOO|nr:hypothetical protein [Candidatus Propionivibrio dominans]